MADDLLTYDQIAERLGVSGATVRQWRYVRRYLEFPPPDLKGPHQADQPYWHWSTVEAWARKYRPDLV